MIPEVAKDAVIRKRRSQFPSTLISEYELSYAAGSLTGKLGLSEEEAAGLKPAGEFAEWKRLLQERVRELEDRMTSDDLKWLSEKILSYRLDGSVNPETVELFFMGYEDR